MSWVSLKPIWLWRINSNKIAMNIYEEWREWMENLRERLINPEQFQLVFLFCVTFTILWHCVRSPEAVFVALLPSSFSIPIPSLLCCCKLRVFIFILFELFMQRKKAGWWLMKHKANDLSRNNRRITINKTNDVNSLASWETIVNKFFNFNLRIQQFLKICWKYLEIFLRMSSLSISRQTADKRFEWMNVIWNYSRKCTHWKIFCFPLHFRKIWEQVFWECYVEHEGKVFRQWIKFLLNKIYVIPSGK